MTYKEFREEVEKHILEHLPGKYADAYIGLHEIAKSNDQKFWSLCICPKGENVTPNIYLEEYYRMYEDGRSMDSVLASIAAVCQEGQREKEELLPFDLMDYESVKDRLYVEILNRKYNQMYLSDSIWRDMPQTDMASVVKILGADKKGKASVSVTVRAALMECWGKTGDEIYEQAVKNAPKLLPAELKNMRDVMLAIHENILTEEEKENFREELNWGRQEGYRERESKNELLPFEQYVLTNAEKLDGAAAIFYPGLLQKIGEATEGRFFILPSSIHEVILMKDNGDMSAEELQRLVMEVNRTQLNPEDVLSDEVYCYDYREQKLTMATDPAQTKELVEQMGEILGLDESAAEAQGNEAEWER